MVYGTSKVRISASLADTKLRITAELTIPVLWHSCGVGALLAAFAEVYISR